MGLKAVFRKTLNSILKRYGHEIVESSRLYQWQKDPQRKPSYKKLDVPNGAEEYLKPSNPRLQDLKERYGLFDKLVTTPLVWTNDHLKLEDILHFRGDNAYVWQLRGHNMNIMAYALTTYYVRSVDTLGLLDKLEEDGQFGNYTFNIGNKLVSRDLLDSIIEIHFLDRHIGLSKKKDTTVLDIGAGYGRLAHRMICGLPNIKEYLCTDGVAVSTFVSEYYLRFRGLEKSTKVIPLDNIENILNEKSVDIAVNIHSFSECAISAIDWWLRILKSSKIEYLMVVPNFGGHEGNQLQTNDGSDMGKIINKHGYRLIAKEPKYCDPIVQEYAINPTYYYLFQLKQSAL